MARGSIVKRVGRTGDTSYLVRVEIGTDPVTGKRIQAAETFRTRKEAERRRTAWLSEIDRGVAARPASTTVRELMTAWLADVAAHRVRETTRKGYEDTIRLHILPELGAIEVQRLTTVRIQAFYSAKLAAGVGARTVQLCHLRLSQALRQAVRWQMVPANVCDNVEPPTVRYKRSGTWDGGQLATFQDAARGDGLSPLWDLLATTGMRRGEALGIRWADVDLERATITVGQSVVASKGAPIFQEPKTIAGRRTIRILPSTVAALRAHRAVWSARKLAAPPELWQDHDLVICTALGGPINPNNVQRNFERIVTAAGLPRIRVHDLRHSHASILLGNGVPVHVVSQRLGHANPSITLSVYAHVMVGMEDAAIDTLERLMERRSS